MKPVYLLTLLLVSCQGKHVVVEYRPDELVELSQNTFQKGDQTKTMFPFEPTYISQIENYSGNLLINSYLTKDYNPDYYKLNGKCIFLNKPFVISGRVHKKYTNDKTIQYIRILNFKIDHKY